MSTERAGLVENMPEAEYRRGPELSATSAKVILRCPAEYHWRRTHPQPRKLAFDKGAVVHRLILGDGDPVHIVDAYDWRTKAAQDARKTHHATGKRVLHRGEFKEATDAARNSRTPELDDIFRNPGRSKAAEVSLFATDPTTGVPLRGRVDLLTESAGQPCVIDVKTTEKSTHPDELAREIATYAYHQQAAFYLDLLAANDLPDAVFYFVFIPLGDGPFEPRIVSLADSALDLGRALNREAINTFSECTDTGQWPCKHDTFQRLDLPAWAYRTQLLEETA